SEPSVPFPEKARALAAPAEAGRRFSDCLADQDIRVLNIVALGGTGKSTLLRKVADHVLENVSRFDALLKIGQPGDAAVRDADRGWAVPRCPRKPAAGDGTVRDSTRISAFPAGGQEGISGHRVGFLRNTRKRFSPERSGKPRNRRGLGGVTCRR